MAVSSKTSSEESPADVQRASSQPKVGRQTPSSRSASPDGQYASSQASARPDADRVAMVSIDVNGEPAQSVNHVLIADHEDLDDEVRAAMRNDAGRALGAKHVDPDEDFGVEELDHEERARTEAKELHNHNFGMRR